MAHAANPHLPIVIWNRLDLMRVARRWVRRAVEKLAAWDAAQDARDRAEPNGLAS